MRPFRRLPAPQFLRENWQKWSDDFAQKRAADPGFGFQWKTFQGQKVNQLLLPDLAGQTQQHCSYCDFFPPRRADETIDHFLPKGDARFWHFVYQWENLYFVCGHCQRVKMEQHDEALLRPDEPGFSFQRYFIVNYSTGEIDPNPAATDVEKHRAETTIRLFGFNDDGQPTARRHSWERYENMPENQRDMDDFAFRFMFE